MHQWMTEVGAEKELAAVGLKPRNTVMLFGPPGCGKTTLAHHIAGRFGLPLVLVDMSALISQYVGGTGQNLHRLMSACRPRAKDLILFLDEFDAIGQKRGASSSADKEKSAIVVHLLQAIDRHEGIIIAATNVEGTIDPALWRRFMMSVVIDAPDDDARFAIIKRYLSPMIMAEEDIDLLSAATDGAMPELIRKLIEGIKREMVLAPRFHYSPDMASVLARIMVTAQPHKDLPVPPLWQPDGLRYLQGINWPPQFPGRAA
jgi:SpoVK/Ycf46/Vps4 family AAA+-type ATPase